MTAAEKRLTGPICSGPIHPLPMTSAEVAARGWDAVDVVFVTGDAYVDHPSFAMALLGRLLEAEGFRVAMLSQPDWHSCRPWRTFGQPQVCFAVSAGNMDSMINHYTAARKVRNDDAYSPAGRIGRRPDRATLAYCQRAREAYKGVPVIAGGVEASLRRLAHYDYWSDKVRRSILLDAKADAIVYGMGERPLLEIVRRLAVGRPVSDLRDIRSVVYRLGANEPIPPFVLEEGQQATSPLPLGEGQGEGLSAGCHAHACRGHVEDAEISPHAHASVDMAPVSSDHRNIKPSEKTSNDHLSDTLILPAYEEVAADGRAFARMTRMIHRESSPHHGRRLVQYHDREAVVVNPPSLPLSESEMDRVYGLPFTRRPHPSYAPERIPAFEVVKNSIQIMRGCCGGCAFCSLGLHQGRIVQSRSERSILDEVRRVADDPACGGVISDLGGPTANMYRMGCGRPEIERKCRRASCLHPSVCRLFQADHGPLIELLKAARRVEGVRRVFVASGVRMDLARRSPAYVGHLARHHTGGRLKVAPEHTDPNVLRLMHKPAAEEFEAFARQFRQAASAAKKDLYLVPYFMSGHPGCDLAAMIELAMYLKRTGYRPDKVQEFIPGPMDVATCMYHTGIDPMTDAPVYVPKGARQRRLQRALMQYWKPENYRDVRQALEEANRQDLIGDGADCLISAAPPKTTGKRRSRNPSGKKTTTGYRPHRKSARRGGT